MHFLKVFWVAAEFGSERFAQKGLCLCDLLWVSRREGLEVYLRAFIEFNHVRMTGLEPASSCLGNRRANLLHLIH